MKPKARFYPGLTAGLGKWVVYGGDLRNGWGQGASLGIALADYQRSQMLSNKHLENVIERQRLEIEHCHAVCDELRQKLNQRKNHEY